jgi:hypothetical protein
MASLTVRKMRASHRRVLFGEMGLARMRTVDETKPYIWIEPTRPPADSSREFGDTAAIHLVVPNVSRVDVPMTRTERNAVAFDYFCKKFKDGINV